MYFTSILGDNVGLTFLVIELTTDLVYVEFWFTLHQGIAEEEKLLFSGEESTAGEQDVHLDSGLRVVQLLELDRIYDQDERAWEESATLVSNVEHEDGQPQGELPSHLPSHEKQQEMLHRDSEFEDISDVSDEGTPERDLPGKLTLNISFGLTLGSFTL